MSLCFHIQAPKEPDDQNQLVQDDQISVSGTLPSVSKSHIPSIVSKVAEVLYSQGVPCCRCRNSRYKLYSYPDDCRRKNRMELTIHCGDGPVLHSPSNVILMYLPPNGYSLQHICRNGRFPVVKADRNWLEVRTAAKESQKRGLPVSRFVQPDIGTEVPCKGFTRRIRPSNRIS